MFFWGLFWCRFPSLFFCRFLRVLGGSFGPFGINFGSILELLGSLDAYQLRGHCAAAKKLLFTARTTSVLKRGAQKCHSGLLRGRPMRESAALYSNRVPMCESAVRYAQIASRCAKVLYCMSFCKREVLRMQARVLSAAILIDRCSVS